jgi:hypothetical protein
MCIRSSRSRRRLRAPASTWAEPPDPSISIPIRLLITTRLEPSHSIREARDGREQIAASGLAILGFGGRKKWWTGREYGGGDHPGTAASTLTNTATVSGDGDTNPTNNSRAVGGIAITAAPDSGRVWARTASTGVERFLEHHGQPHRDPGSELHGASGALREHPRQRRAGPPPGRMRGGPVLAPSTLITAAPSRACRVVVAAPSIVRSRL